MNSEWRDLKTMLEVAQAQENGDEIMVYHHNGSDWQSWSAIVYNSKDFYRARSKPKAKQVKLLAWFDTCTLNLKWYEMGSAVSGDWKRVPSLDMTAEVEE